MPFLISESFRVPAPVDRVFGYLLDLPRVVECLPGAAITEVIDERTFAGRIQVKLGPMTAAYAGRVRLAEVDANAHRVRITGEGKEPVGTGTARMEMRSEMVPLPDGGSEVRVDAVVDLAGKTMQFGRGMIQSVSAQLFHQFAECVRVALESTEATLAADESTSASPDAVAPVTSADGARRSVGSDRSDEAVRIVPVLLRALWSSITRLFGRKRRDA